MRVRVLPGIVVAAAVAASVSGVAAASTVKLPPVAKTYKAPAKSPVAFAKVRSAQGSVKSLAKGTPLKAGQTVELIVAKGNEVVPASDCACQGLGLVQPKGQRLVSVFVEARSAAGKTLAVAPASKLFIEGNGSSGLSVGFTYEFARGTKAFPTGSQLVTFALFSK
jgi:hypothetical protein